MCHLAQGCLLKPNWKKEARHQCSLKMPFLKLFRRDSLSVIRLLCTHALPACLCASELTTFHLEQGFGQDAAGHTDGLADVIARIFDLDVGDGQLTTQRHRETARLWRLLDWEQQDLEKKTSCTLGFLLSFFTIIYLFSTFIDRTFTLELIQFLKPSSYTSKEVMSMPDRGCSISRKGILQPYKILTDKRGPPECSWIRAMSVCAVVFM